MNVGRLPQPWTAVSLSTSAHGYPYRVMQCCCLLNLQGLVARSCLRVRRTTQLFGRNSARLQLHNGPRRYRRPSRLLSRSPASGRLPSKPVRFSLPCCGRLQLLAHLEASGAWLAAVARLTALLQCQRRRQLAPSWRSPDRHRLSERLSLVPLETPQASVQSPACARVFCTSERLSALSVVARPRPRILRPSGACSPEFDAPATSRGSAGTARCHKTCDATPVSATLRPSLHLPTGSRALRSLGLIPGRPSVP